MEKESPFGLYDRCLAKWAILVAIGNGISVYHNLFAQSQMDFRCIDDLHAFTDDTETFLIYPVANVTYRDGDVITRDKITDADIWAWEHKPQSYKTSEHECWVPWETCLRGMVWSNGKSFKPGQISIYYTYDLVGCDGLHVVANTIKYEYPGLIIGSLIGGILCDQFGRRLVQLSTGILCPVLLLAISFAPTVQVYTILQITLAAVTSIDYLVCIILTTELFSPRSKWLSSTLEYIGYNVGYALVPIFAYILPDWKQHLRVFALINALLLYAHWKIPESPTWLEGKGLFTRGRKARTYIADIEGFLVDDSNETKQKLDIEINRHSLLDLWSHPTARKHLLILSICVWPVIHLIATEFLVTAEIMTGSPYFDFLIDSGFVLVVVPFAGYLTKYGVRKMMLACLLVMAAAALVSLVIPNLTVACSWIGRFAVSFALNNIWILVAQLFPSHIRASGTGIASAAGNATYLVAPYMQKLRGWHPRLYWAASAAICLASCGGLYYLPEIDVEYPIETLGDLEGVTRRQVRSPWHTKNQSSH